MARVVLAAAATVALGTGSAAVAGVAPVAAGVATDDGPLTKPLQHSIVTQEFGCTPYRFEPRDAACPSGHFHSGIDLAAAAGTAVHALRGGTVHVAVQAGGYGLYLVIDHGNGLSSLYGHLASVTVAEGDRVAGGEVVGAEGSSGNSTGPHLHFEIRRDGRPEDPRTDLLLP